MAGNYLSLMFGLRSAGDAAQPVLELVSNLGLTVIPLAAIGCLPIVPTLVQDLRLRARRSPKSARLALRGVELAGAVAVVCMLWLSLIFATSATFDPFIYFRF
jgi:hypothetical protein